MLTPFAGSHRDDTLFSAYNFYLSQVRIKIEQSFGLMVKKWAILQTHLQCKLKHVKIILHSCVRLHNFVITNQYELLSEPDMDAVVHSMDETERAPDLELIQTEGIEGHSHLRDIIVQRIDNNNQVRPAHNIIRRYHEMNRNNK